MEISYINSDGLIMYDRQMMCDYLSVSRSRIHRVIKKLCIEPITEHGHVYIYCEDDYETIKNFIEKGETTICC